MEFIFEGADFSQNNIGNTRWSENWMIARGITDSAKKTAVRAFYNTVNPFIDKFAFLYIMNSGNADLDKLNILNPYDQAGTYRAVFNNDNSASHTTNGYMPNAGGNRYATSEFLITSAAQMNNFHLHIFNKTADGANRFLGGMWINASGSNVFVNLARNHTSQTKGGVSVNGSYPLIAPNGTDLNGTGLLSVVRQGGTQKLFEDGTLLVSATASPAITIASPQPIYIGTAGLYTTDWISSATISFAAGGTPSTPLTDAQMTIFSSAVNTLLAAL